MSVNSFLVSMLVYHSIGDLVIRLRGVDGNCGDLFLLFPPNFSNLYFSFICFSHLGFLRSFHTKHYDFSFFLYSRD